LVKPHGIIGGIPTPSVTVYTGDMGNNFGLALASDALKGATKTGPIVEMLGYGGAASEEDRGREGGLKLASPCCGPRE
jgi:hypothetical protein